MAFTHFTNLTPLTVRVTLLGSANVLAVLKPGDETVIKTPSSSAFEVTDESGRFVVTRDAVARSEAQDIPIKQDVIRINPSKTSSGIARFVNTLPAPLKLVLCKDLGTSVAEVSKQDLAAGKALRMKYEPGLAYRLRGSANEKLDLTFLFKPDEKPGEEPVIQIAERSEWARRLEAGDPSVRYGRYDAVRADLLATNPTDTKYIRYGHQTIGSREINGWVRPVRRVTISGADVVFDNSDRSRFLSLYQGQEDIAELFIHADTVTVKSKLRFPATNVYIYCRALQFEGADACIDTTPINKTFRDPASIDGENGSRGGNFLVYALYFQTDQKKATHFRARGSRGQDPDEGGVEISTTARNLEAISEEKWNSFFSPESRRLPHYELFFDKYGKYSVMPFPDFKVTNRKFPNIVYIEIKNSYYQHNMQEAVVTDPEILRVWGTKEEPGKGGKGKRAGRPGVGGPGGQFKCSLEQIKPYVDLAGGESGKALGPTPGGAGGTPSLALWWFIEGRPDGDNHPIKTRWEEKRAQDGDPSEAGPPPQAAAGPGGQFVLASQGSSAWISPINISVALQFARDACASGHADYAVATLSPYVSALAGQTPAAGVEQLLREARELLRLARNNADFFGKPPGWVPTLSLQSAAGIYDALLPQAMNELYASYYIERVARSKQDKQKALQSFSQSLNSSNETAKTELQNLRKELPKAIGELSQILTEVADVEDKVEKRRKFLRDQADKEAASQEQKEAIAAAFKITATVIKAIPLPEPFQTAASGLGSIFDIAGGFIDQGGSDAAFENLKTQVAGFAGGGDSLSGYMNAVNEASLDVSDLEKQAQATRKLKEKLEPEYGKEADALEKLKQRQKEIYDAKKEALLYSRAKTAKERAQVVKRADTLTSSYLDDIQKLENATNSKLGEYQAAKAKVGKIEEQISSAKTAFEAGQAERDQKKAANTELVATRMQQLQKVANSVASIGATLNKLAVSKSQLNSRFDEAVAKLAKEDQEFSNLCQRIKFLNEKKEAVAKKVSQLSADIVSDTDKISRNLLALNEIAGQIATNNESLDASALAYIQSIGQDAHLTLTRFLYYTVKAYEYYMVRPWAQSYVTAQKLFDDLRCVLEPSTFRLDVATDPGGDKQKQIDEILAADPRKGGMLSAAEFGILKAVYEKPLLDMGRQLATELMEANSSALKETQSTVTLTAGWLADLNDRIQSPDKREQVIFNLADLRQIGRSVEKQRIANIRVIGVQAIKSGSRFPDTIKFVFEQVGKSIVRSQGRLFAFEPQSSAADSGNGFEGSGVTFETQGGKRASQPEGWVETTKENKSIGTLNVASLWQPDRTPQENLLSKLLKNPATLSLSQFRPGAFSDFLLRVDLNPPECKIAFTEIVLEISYEGGYASHDELLICVNTNAGLDVPISCDTSDMSGRHGAVGRYVGVFNLRNMAAAGQRAVRVQVPSQYGRYLLKGWEINGESVNVPNDYYEAAKDAYIVVNYADRVSDAAPLALEGHA